MDALKLSMLKYWRYAVLIVFAIVAVIIAFIIRQMLLNQPPQTPNPSITPRAEEIEKYRIPENAFPPLPEEPAEVFMYTGNVTALAPAQSQFTLSTLYGDKTVTFSKDTVMEVEQNPLNASAVKPTITPLALGDLLRAVSSSNIRGAQAFTASKLILIK